MWADTGETPRVVFITVKSREGLRRIVWEDLDLVKIDSGRYALHARSNGTVALRSADDLIQIRKHLFVAAIFSATILPVATAFYVCEAFGFEAGIILIPDAPSSRSPRGRRSSTDCGFPWSWSA